MTLEKKSYDSLEVFASSWLSIAELGYEKDFACEGIIVLLVSQALVYWPFGSILGTARKSSLERPTARFNVAVGSVRVSHWLRDLDNRLKARK